MHKYLAAFSAKDNYIPYLADYITTRLLQEITLNHINLSDRLATNSTESGHSLYQIHSHCAINFTYVDCNFNKCRGRAKAHKHDDSDMYVDQQNI